MQNPINVISWEEQYPMPIELKEPTGKLVMTTGLVAQAKNNILEVRLSLVKRIVFISDFHSGIV